MDQATPLPACPKTPGHARRRRLLCYNRQPAADPVRTGDPAECGEREGSGRSHHDGASDNVWLRADLVQQVSDGVVRITRIKSAALLSIQPWAAEPGDHVHASANP